MSTKTNEQTAIAGDVVKSTNGYTDHVQQTSDGESRIKAFLSLSGQIDGITHNLTNAKSSKIRGMMSERDALEARLNDERNSMSPEELIEARARLDQKRTAKRASLRDRAENSWQALHDASLSAALTATSASRVALSTQKCISEAIRMAQSRHEDYWEHLPIELRSNAKLRFMQVFADGIAAVYENEVAEATGRFDPVTERPAYKVVTRFNVVVNDPTEGFYWASSIANAKLQDVRLYLAAEQLETETKRVSQSDEETIVTVGKEYLRTKVA